MGCYVLERGERRCWREKSGVKPEEVVEEDERRWKKGLMKGRKDSDAAQEVEGLRRRRKGVFRAAVVVVSPAVSCGGDVGVEKATEVRKKTVVDTVVERR